MGETASSVLTPWSNFYIMIGSSAAALTGLMFVVITLVTGAERLRNSGEAGISAFSTPTVVHFGAALLIAAMLSAPWRSLIYPAVLLGLVGFCGVTYILHVMRRTRQLTTYSADVEDWIWYTILPFAAYGTIFASGIGLLAFPAALFVSAAGVMLLIFIGIRNAWDIVTFIALEGGAEPPQSS